MPTLEENKSYWDDQYDWERKGDEWSATWGGPTIQWYGTLLPRIHRYLPADTILEIAPGFGRWTDFLKDHCRKLIVVDLSQKCIDACRERFKACSHITYFVNDGQSLKMIDDHAVDFAFSFDSLVHAEDRVISEYVSQLARKLGREGVAFLHHSNLGEYSVDSIVKGGEATHGRDPSMTAESMRRFADKNGLKCISQEVVTWGTQKALIDCLSTIGHEGCAWTAAEKVFRNPEFMKEAQYLRQLSQLYGA